MKALTVALLLLVAALPARSASESWVTTDRLNRRTCPDTRCGTVGILMFREKATVYEEKDGWARISKYYDASCRNGQSDYVDSGNAACIGSNGIVAGEFAEWVSMNYLSIVRPPDPGSGATGSYSLVSGSDDYGTYKDAFAKAASSLVDSGQCTVRDFRNMGGWMKSMTDKSRPIYFTYCGQDRLYLNAETGEVFR